MRNDRQPIELDSHLPTVTMTKAAVIVTCCCCENMQPVWGQGEITGLLAMSRGDGGVMVRKSQC